VGGVDDEDRGVGSQEQVEVFAVEMEGGFGAHDDGENDSGLSFMINVSIGTPYESSLCECTFVCQRVMDVDVMTANRCPARDMRMARIGSLAGTCSVDLDSSSPGKSCAEESSWRSTDWTAGV
jgi:hypothetical protein